ncbi:MAG: hypothetical protein ACREF9_01655 [Opitutaceae bacterium]
MSSNSRYLEALAVVDDPTQAIKGLNAMTQRKRTPAGQSVKAYNPLSQEEQRIFKALLSDAHAMSGFRNAEVREQLAGSGFLKILRRCLRSESAKISRLLKDFHVYASPHPAYTALAVPTRGSLFSALLPAEGGNFSRTAWAILCLNYLRKFEVANKESIP